MRKLHQTDKKTGPSAFPSHPPAASLTATQLDRMTTDDLVNRLMSPELAQPANAALKHKIIPLLRERKSDKYVSHLLGAPATDEKT